jgi:pimeloyl-ACP methyl ester carboxylesterase
MGSTVATAVAAMAPERVVGLALCAGFVAPDPALRSLVELWRKLLPGSPEVVARFIAAVEFSQPHLFRLGHDDLEALVRDIATNISPSTGAHLDLILNVDVSAQLAAARQPLLVVVPTFDTMVGPQHSAVIGTLRPDAHRVELTSGHALGTEVGTEWLHALEEFLGRIEADQSHRQRQARTRVRW